MRPQRSPSVAASDRGRIFLVPRRAAQVRSPCGLRRPPRSCGFARRRATIRPRLAPHSTGSIHANSQSRRLRPACLRRRPRLQQFRPAHRPGNLAQGDPQGDRPRHHAVRYRRHLCRHGRLRDRAGRSARRPPQGHRAGDQILQADEQRRHQAGRLAALHHVRGRGQPEAAEDRLHRPLPAARLRSADADRGDACGRSTTWCGRARCATSAIRISRPGASPRPN